jgi:hypothetical protein
VPLKSRKVTRKMKHSVYKFLEEVGRAVPRLKRRARGQ